MEEFAIPLLKVLPFSVVHDAHERSFSARLLGFRVASAYFHGDAVGCVLHRSAEFGCLLDEPAPIDEQSAATPPTRPPIEALERLIDGEFASVLPNGEKRNVRAIVVMQDGAIVAERYRAPFTRNTRQAGWSMTKSLLNTLVGVRGLDLQQLAYFPNGTQSQRIRLGHLINMTSGLDWDEEYGVKGVRFGDPTYMLFNERDMPAFVANRAQAHEPGSHWHYRQKRNSKQTKNDRVPPRGVPPDRRARAARATPICWAGIWRARLRRRASSGAGRATCGDSSACTRSSSSPTPSAIRFSARLVRASAKRERAAPRVFRSARRLRAACTCARAARAHRLGDAARLGALGPRHHAVTFSRLRRRFEAS